MEVRLDYCFYFLFLFSSVLHCTKDVHFALLNWGSIEVTLTTQDQYARTYFQRTTTAVQGGLAAVMLHAFTVYWNWFCFISSLYYCNITLVFCYIFLGHWTVVIFASCALCSLIILYVVTGKCVLKVICNLLDYFLWSSIEDIEV